MSKLTAQVTAAVEMARTVGLGPTRERLTNFARARLLGRARAAQFRRLRLEGPVIRDILGSRMTLDPAVAGLDRDLLLDGIREPIATGHLMRLLRPEDVVLEVGANIGYYALIEARLCRQVYAVEPHPENFQRLNANVRLNGYTNIETENLAFGDATGTVPMRCSGHSNWHTCRGAVAGADTIDVPCARIDDFVAGRLPPTVIKMDVEGFEFTVLRGAMRTLAAVRCVFLELHGDILGSEEIRAVIDLLTGAGLEASLIAQYDRPGLARLAPPEHLDAIYRGDRGTYELFLTRPDAAAAATGGAAPAAQVLATS